MAARFTTILAYGILMLLFFTISIISLLILPLLIFGLFSLLSIIFSMFFIRAVFSNIQRHPKREEGMSGTDDENLFQAIEEMQKKNRGKQIGQK